MSVYSNYSKLGRVKLPSGTTYALVDVDGRGMLAPDFEATGVYTANDYVIYQDDLYRSNGAFGPAVWDATKFTKVTVSSEFKAVWSSITGGIHYRGYTTSSLYDGSTTNPIIIGGSAVTVVAGDLVVEDPAAYATNTAYNKGEYVIYDNKIYNVLESITAVANTDWSDMSVRVAATKPEFLWSGSVWNEIGSLNPGGLGTLAYKNSASGVYIKPTGSGSVSVPTVSKTTTNLDIETSGNTVTVNTGYTANSSKLETESISYNTDAIKSAALGGDTTFARAGVTAVIDGDCLTFSNADTGTVTISTTAASSQTKVIATGGLKSDDAHGASVSTGISSNGTQSVLKDSATLKKVSSGGDVSLVDEVIIGSETRVVSVSTTTDTVTVA